MTDLLQHWATQLPRHAGRPDFAVRAAAMQDALASNLPLRQVETWKYTSLRALARRQADVLEPVAIPAGLLEQMPSPRLVFVNGVFDGNASDYDDLPGMSLSVTPDSTPFPAGGPANSLNQVNVALNQGGIDLTVHAASDQTLHLVWLAGTDELAGSQHNLHRIELTDAASLRVVEHVVSIGEHKHIATNRMQIVLNDNAVLDHCRVQMDAAEATWFARTDVEQHSNSIYRRLDLELGSSLTRHELNIDLVGDGAQLFSNGVLFGDSKRQLDTQLNVNHKALHTNCDLIWRGLGTERSRIAFAGRIYIEQGADFTAASLSNKNLLLSDNSEIDSQPVLEIYADEVQAAHGTTVGQLDENALFYLRSRGIGDHEARTMLLGAFVHELLSVVDNDPLREWLAGLLDTALQGVEFA